MGIARAREERREVVMKERNNIMIYYGLELEMWRIVVVFVKDPDCIGKILFVDVCEYLVGSPRIYTCRLFGAFGATIAIFMEV